MTPEKNIQERGKCLKEFSDIRYISDEKPTRTKMIVLDERDRVNRVSHKMKEYWGKIKEA